MSEGSCVVHPWYPLLCRSYGFVIMVCSSQLIITYRSWRLHGCAWSMILSWPRSLESVGLLDLCRKVEIRNIEWLYFEYTRTKQVTRADIIRAFTTISKCCWSLATYPLRCYTTRQYRSCTPVCRDSTAVPNIIISFSASLEDRSYFGFCSSFESAKRMRCRYNGGSYLNILSSTKNPYCPNK